MKRKATKRRNLGAFPFKPKSGARTLRAEQPVRVPRRVEVGIMPGFDYTTKSQPCNTDRKGCPIQLRYESGQATLVMCGKRKRQVVGKVRVKDAFEANKIAREACLCWAQTKNLAKCKASITSKLSGLKKKAAKKRARR